MPVLANPKHDPAKGTGLGWKPKQPRAKAIDLLMDRKLLLGTLVIQGCTLQWTAIMPLRTLGSSCRRRTGIPAIRSANPQGEEVVGDG
jgi:hypothetical protein